MSRFPDHVGHRIVHSWRYDAAACEACDVWLEPECQCGLDDECPFPGPRPERPSLADGEKLGPEHWPPTRPRIVNFLTNVAYTLKLDLVYERVVARWFP